MCLVVVLLFVILYVIMLIRILIITKQIIIWAMNMFYANRIMRTQKVDCASKFK